jgi:hypothetical protein
MPLLKKTESRKNSRTRSNSRRTQSPCRNTQMATLRSAYVSPLPTELRVPVTVSPTHPVFRDRVPFVDLFWFAKKLILNCPYPKFSFIVSSNQTTRHAIPWLHRVIGEYDRRGVSPVAKPGCVCYVSCEVIVRGSSSESCSPVD